LWRKQIENSRVKYFQISLKESLNNNNNNMTLINTATAIYITLKSIKPKQEVMQSQRIQIRRGIFQGDSLSPMLFCIAITPLTSELNRTECGYRIYGTDRKISHLLYRDDLKLLGRYENDLQNELKIVQTINKDINMNFGLEKCARMCLKRGRFQSKVQIGNTLENDIKELDPREAYKYLGIKENFDIQHKIEKEKLKNEYLRRLRLVLGTELNAKNKIQAIRSLAVPILRYSFGIVN
jgi:hypothetical protein